MRKRPLVSCHLYLGLYLSVPVSWDVDDRVENTSLCGGIPHLIRQHSLFGADVPRLRAGFGVIPSAEGLKVAV